LRGTAVFQADKGEDREANKETIEAAMGNEQAGHTLYITRLVYARSIIE
jgi:hypothetical protein